PAPTSTPATVDPAEDPTHSGPGRPRGAGAPSQADRPIRPPLHGGHPETPPPRNRSGKKRIALLTPPPYRPGRNIPGRHLGAGIDPAAAAADDHPRHTTPRRPISVSGKDNPHS